MIDLAIKRDEVKDVAYLSRLEMTEDELDKFSTQLSRILEYASMLDQLDLSTVEPTSHAVPLKNVFREDEVKPSFPVSEILANAPDPRGNYFCVPKIIDEEGR